MNVTLISNFTKRYNSTKQATGGTVYDCKLKEDTSVLNPVFIISGVNTTAHTFSAAKAWGNYYFVDDVVFITNDICEVHCSIDVMATFKTQIGSTSAMVLYANTTNTEISDKRLSTKTTTVYDSSSGTFGKLGNITNPANAAVLLTVSGYTKTDSSVVTWALTQAQVKALFADWVSSQTQAAKNLKTDSGFTETVPAQTPSGMDEANGITFLSKVLVWSMQHNPRFVMGGLAPGTRAITDQVYNEAELVSMDTEKAIQYINGCVVTPFQVSDLVGTSGRVYLGPYDTGIDGIMLTSRTLSDTCTLSIPWQATDWRRNSPYHDITVNIPWAGTVNINASQLIGTDSIVVQAGIDVVTGQAIFEVRRSSVGGKVVGRVSSNINSSFPLGINAISPVSIASDIVSLGIGVGSLASGNVAGAATLASSTIGLVNDLVPTPHFVDGGGGMGALALPTSNQCACYVVFHDTTVTPSSVASAIGVPVNKVVTISSYSGFIQTSGASVQCSSLKSVKDKINSIMDGGFFYE